jgi:hypothetical protein
MSPSFTFVKLREMLATNEELARKVAQHDRQITVLFDQVQKMLAAPPPKKSPIGYIHPQRLKPSGHLQASLSPKTSHPKALNSRKCTV